MAHHRMKRMTAALVVATAIAGVSGDVLANCLRASDLGAVHSRQVQTELMVAALTCDRRDVYNGFVRKFESKLIDRGQDLKRLFRRLHGPKSEAQLNGFVTRLANEASMRSVGTRQFCKQADGLFAAVGAMTHVDFDAFTAQRAAKTPHGLPLCRDAGKIIEARR